MTPSAVTFESVGRLDYKVREMPGGIRIQSQGAEVWRCSICAALVMAGGRDAHRVWHVRSGL